MVAQRTVPDSLLLLRDGAFGLMLCLQLTATMQPACLGMLSMFGLCTSHADACFACFAEMSSDDEYDVEEQRMTLIAHLSVKLDDTEMSDGDVASMLLELKKQAVEAEQVCIQLFDCAD